MGRSLGLGFFKKMEIKRMKLTMWRVVVVLNPGGALGYFLGGYMCRPGLQIATPF